MKEDEYWNKYSDQWTPILHFATRLNPFMTPSNILTDVEIGLADQEISNLLTAKLRVQPNIRN